MENENVVTIEKDELKKAIDESVKAVVKAVVKELKLDEIQDSRFRGNDNPGTHEFENPGYALHSLLCAIKSGQKDKIREIYQRDIAAGEKSASPMTEGT